MDRQFGVGIRGCASLCFVVTACAAPLSEIRAQKPGDAPTGAWNRIHLKASEELACKVDALTTRTLETQEDATAWKYSFEITGCGRTAIYFLAAEKSGVWAFASDMDLRHKLKFSYGDRCPNWSVQFIDRSTRGVDACGQKLIYVYSASGWVANTMTNESGKME